jgi:sulfatase modifying factor 1
MNDEDPNRPSEAWCLELQETEQAMQADRVTPSNRFALYLDPQRTVPMLFRYVPPTQGNFWIGAADVSQYFTDELSYDSEPITQIEIPYGYWMATFPTTQQQWGTIEALMGRASPRKSTFQGRYRPMENISWDDCQEWLTTLNSQQHVQEQLKRLNPSKVPAENHEGADSSLRWTIRLPAEAHWEWACRATQAKGNPNKWVTGMTQYHAGDGTTALQRCGWYSDNSSNHTHRVGEKESNTLGLYDMHGNVLEWCEDAWMPDYRHLTNGMSVMQMVETSKREGDQRERVVRGGSWNSFAGGCWSAYRFGRRPDIRYRIRGFRVGLFPGPNRAQASKAQTDLEQRRAAEKLRESDESQRAGITKMSHPPRSSENF